MVSALAPSSIFSTLCGPCILSGSYIRASGTSMAAPVVSGIAALMLEKRPDLTPNQVKGILTAEQRRASSGVRVVSAEDAVRAAVNGSRPAANVGLVPHELVDTGTGEIDYSRSSWSRSSWSTASGPLSADFARSSWSCSSCDLLVPDESVQGTRSSWSRSSWSTIPPN
jgi:serine protease AprX